MKKTAAALTNWVAPVWPDLQVVCHTSEIDALSAERDALWARVSRADFLSEDEKRSALGLAPREEGSHA